MAAPDVKSTLMLSRIKHARTVTSALSSGMAAHVSGNRSIASNYKTFVEKMKEAAGNESCADLQTAMYVLSTATDNVEKVRGEVLCGRHEDLILKVLKEYPQRSYRPAERMVADRDATLAAHAAAEKKKADMVSQGKAGGPDFEKASRDVISHLQRVENVDFMFQENSQLFELQRLRDMKRMLSEYVAAQLTFHAKAMENLSAAAQALGSFDPDAGMDVLGGALAANRAPHSPEEEAPSSTDHARSIMDSIPRTGLLPAHVTRRGFEAGGVAPSRGVTFEDAEGQDEEGPPPTLGSEGAGGFSGGSQDHPADSARSGGSGAFLPPDDSPGAAPAPPRARTQGGPAQVPPPAAVPAPAPSSGGGATAGQEKKPGFFKKWFGGGGSAGTSGTAEASTARPAGESSATAAASGGSAPSAGAPSPAPAPAEASAGTGIDSD